MVRTRHHGSFEVFSPALAAQQAPAPTVTASRAAFEQAGVGPRDIDVMQLQDTDSGSEIIHMAENGFCEHGEQERLLRDGETEIGGRLPVNTDGGCLANGEPIGASGLRQVHRDLHPVAPGSRTAPGAGQAQARLHPCLWRAGCQRRHHPAALVGHALA